MDNSSNEKKKTSQSVKEEIPKFQEYLTIDIENQLQAFPEAIKLLHKMREHIKKQNKKIIKLRNRVNEQVSKNHVHNLIFVSQRNHYFSRKS